MRNFFDFSAVLIPSMLFGLLGLGIIAYIASSTAKNLFGNPLGWLDRIKLRGARSKIEGIDRCIAVGGYMDGLKLAQTAFLLQPPHLANFIDPYHNHNVALLERLVSISEGQHSRLDSLPLIEELLQVRSELLHSQFELTSKLQDKLRAKDLPEWGRNEYDRKLVELRERLTSNRKNLDEQLAHLFSAVRLGKNTETITYH